MITIEVVRKVVYVTIKAHLTCYDNKRSCEESHLCNYKDT